MDRDLIELQKGCKATCCVILDNDIDELENKYVIDATKSKYPDLYLGVHNPSAFMQYSALPKDQDFYFVIRHIDLVQEDIQRYYYGVVKDRIINVTKSLPDDYIFILTVEKRDSLKQIIPELYHLCVVCI